MPFKKWMSGIACFTSFINENKMQYKQSKKFVLLMVRVLFMSAPVRIGLFGSESETSTSKTKGGFGCLSKPTLGFWKSYLAKIPDNRQESLLQLCLCHIQPFWIYYEHWKRSKKLDPIQYDFNISQRLSTWVSFVSRQKKKSFIWKIVTSDEKSIYDDNPTNKKPWQSGTETTFRA